MSLLGFSRTDVISLVGGQFLILFFISGRKYQESPTPKGGLAALGPRHNQHEARVPTSYYWEPKQAPQACDTVYTGIK